MNSPSDKTEPSVGVKIEVYSVNESFRMTYFLEELGSFL